MSDTLDVTPEAQESLTAAQLDDAPFYEEGPIPTADVSLEEGDSKPDAFGDDSTAAPEGVEDGVLESPVLRELDGEDIPKTYRDAAEAIGEGDAGNEFDNTSVAEWHLANSTSAGSLSVEPNEPSKSESSETGETDEKKPEAPKRRGRRSNAEIEAEKKAAAEAADDKAVDEDSKS